MKFSQVMKKILIKIITLAIINPPDIIYNKWIQINSKIKINEITRKMLTINKENSVLSSLFMLLHLINHSFY